MPASQRTVGDQKSTEKSLCWMTSQMRNEYKMTFDFCAFGAKWRRRTTVLAGHVDSADVWALHTMRCHGQKRCNFTVEKHMQLVGYDSSHHCSRTQKQNVSCETGKQTRESAFGTHPHRPNAENML